MTSFQSAMLRRLRTIEERLDRLEATASATSVFWTPPQHPSQAAVQPPANAPAWDDPSRPDERGYVAAPSPAATQVHPPVAQTPKAAAFAAAQSRPVPDVETDDSPGLERIIGGRWYAVLGGLVVIIGVAFFYQYALQQGWFRVIPDWLKCLSGAAFGAGLLAAAEFIRPRINAWAAAGLAIAGIGTMYVSTFAAHARYDLLGVASTFLLLSVCAGVGVVFAARARLVAVALASLIGGYITPLLLHDPARAYILPPYWAMLLLVGLMLSARLGGSFRTVRALTVAMTLLFGVGWIAAKGAQYPFLAIALLAFTWAAIHTELWWAATRTHAPSDDPDAEDMHNTRETHGIPEWRAWSPLLTSFVVTTWTVGVGVLHAREWGQIPDWLPPAIGAAVTTVVSLVLAGNLRVLRDAPATGPERFGAGLCAQGGGLLIAAVGLAFAGWLEVVVWLGMGVAGILAGRWLDARPLRLYGAGLLTIATTRLLFYDSLFGGMTAGPTGAAHGLVLSRWMLLVMIAAAAWMVAAVLAAIDSPRSRTPDSAGLDRAAGPGALPALLAAVSITVLACSFLHQHASAGSIALAWMAIAAVLIPMTGLLRAAGLTVIADRLALTPLAAGPALAALVPWSFAFIAPGWSTFNDPPGLHRGLIIALLLGAEFIWAAWAMTARPSDDPDVRDRRDLARAGSLALAVLLLFTATSFEAARAAGLFFADRTAQLAAVSIWWGLFSIGLLAAGFMPITTGQAKPHTPRHTLGRLPRQAGLALLGLATAKALFLDTAQVSLGWRVISVLGLGLLMLAVGIVYARLTGRENARSA